MLFTGHRAPSFLDENQADVLRSRLTARMDGGTPMSFSKKASITLSSDHPGSTRTSPAWSSEDVTGGAAAPCSRRLSARDLGMLLEDLARRVFVSMVFSCLMVLLTAFVLVGDDVKMMFFEADADLAFEWLTGVCCILFALETMLFCLFKEEYFPGFWFFADLVALVSLILDFDCVSLAIVGSHTISSDGGASNQGTTSFGGATARAARSSRVGSRIARLLRVLRLVRMSRVLKAFHEAAWSCGCGGLATKPGDVADVEELRAESRVGKQLAERMPQRVVLIVLTLLIMLPHLQPGDSYVMVSTSAQYGADVVFQAWLDFASASSAAESLEGNASTERLSRRRLEWEIQTLIYIYYHTYDELTDWLFTLCWLGYIRKPHDPRGNHSMDLLTQAYLTNVAAMTASAADVGHMIGTIPEAIMEGLGQPWTTDCTESRSPLIGVSLMPGVPCPRKLLRAEETVWYVPMVSRKDLSEADFDGNFVFVFDIRGRTKWEAAMSILQTLLVVIVLAIGALVFSRDVNKLVLQPIERMISQVQKIRNNPLYAIKLGEARAESKLFQEAQPLSMLRRASFAEPLVGLAPPLRGTTLETKVLENTIIKLGSLLALGFGEAGVEIIATTLDEENSVVTAKIPGTKVEAIFGFCDIRHFHIATEVLKESTMVFVNKVAEIVHRTVDRHLGAANKNLGQAFLMVWQLNDFEEKLQRKVADLSVMAFIQVVAELSRDSGLAKFSAHPLLASRMPNFRVSLGFGLHLGWAIAGAIGSEFKIEASYVSPHVNLTAQLEAATQEFDVTILMSEPLVRACSVSFSRHFRAVDRVRLAGSNRATQLFTMDLDSRQLSPELVPKRRNLDRYAVRRARERRRLEVLQDDHQVHVALFMDKHVRKMRQHLSLPFFQEFERAFLNYIAGEWAVAAAVLARTRTMLNGGGDDGPSRVLLEYMQAFGCEAPPTWPGWRKLELG